MHVSPDGRFEWNGTEWVPRTADAPEAPVSPDGNYRWTGSEWAPIHTTANVAPPASGAPQAPSSGSNTLVWKVVAGLGVGIGAVALIVALGSGGSEAPAALAGSPEPVAPAATSTPTAPSAPSDVSAPPTDSESESPEADPSTSAMSPALFALDGEANASELLKDASDAQTALEQGGTFRLVSNGAEMSFNLAQLQALTPPEGVANKWNAAMSDLQEALDDYTQAIDGDSVSKIAAAIDTIETAARTARKIAQQTAP